MLTRLTVRYMPYHGMHCMAAGMMSMAAGMKSMASCMMGMAEGMTLRLSLALWHVLWNKGQLLTPGVTWRFDVL